jgi:hypothetical protein
LSASTFTKPIYFLEPLKQIIGFKTNCPTIYRMKRILTHCLIASCFTLIAMALCNAGSAQTTVDAKYLQTITQRSNKIIVTLGITDSAKFYKVQDIVVKQYMTLNSFHESYNAKLKEIKKDSTINKNIASEKAMKVEEEKSNGLTKLHKEYISQLSAQLNEDQITKVKDGMTYGVLPITYKGYQEMLPDLTQEQKSKIYDYLVEAREHAMDAESSEKKHAWFGKYKGKINNYLSAAGIDMKKAGKEWEERIKASKQNKHYNYKSFF